LFDALAPFGDQHGIRDFNRPQRRNQYCVPFQRD
jgi:hypothetical protein